RANRSDFVSRRLYGCYVGQVAKRALERPGFMHVPDRVVGLTHPAPECFVLETGSGTYFRARAVVLATGNALPDDRPLPLEVRLHPGYVADPWRFDYRAVGGHVLLVGAGL